MTPKRQDQLYCFPSPKCLHGSIAIQEKSDLTFTGVMPPVSQNSQRTRKQTLRPCLEVLAREHSYSIPLNEDQSSFWGRSSSSTENLSKRGRRQYMSKRGQDHTREIHKSTAFPFSFRPCSCGLRATDNLGPL